MSYNLEGYIDVPTRMAAFYAKYPDGSVQMDPPVFTTVDGKAFVWAQARAYRNADDVRPGVGTAWEQIPGTTPYTRGSELMNLETSCWGRAIAAVMPVDKIATLEEIAFADARRVDTVDQARDRMGSYPTPSGKRINNGDASATEPQLKKLRYEISRQHINEVMLNDFTTERLGFEIPADGIAKLTKAQASALIDALAKVTVQGPQRSNLPIEDDPWATS